MPAENPDGASIGAIGTDDASGGLGSYHVLLSLTTGGYLIAIAGSSISAWILPQLLGYQLDWTRQASGLFAADGVVVGSIFRVAFASFPILFAVCIVAIDIAVIRSLADGPIRNPRGLAAWSLFGVTGLTALLVPVNSILPPYGIVRLLSTPALGVAGAAVVAMAAGVAGVAGLSIPVSLARERVSLATAIARAVADVRSAPVTAVTPIRPVVLGWGFGGGLLVLGTGLLGLAFGLFVLGVLLVPVVLVTWGLAALAFAGGHLRYRLHTVSPAFSD